MRSNPATAGALIKPRWRLPLIVFALACLGTALYLNHMSARWVPEADARVRAAQGGVPTARELDHQHQTLDALTLAAAQRPLEVEAQLKLARGLVEHQSFAAALLPAERAIRLAPESVEANVLGAQIYTTLGYRARAEAHYRRAIRAAPTRLEGYQGLGAFLLASERRAEAQKVFEEARKRSPDLIGPALSLAQLYLDDNKPAEADEVLSAFPAGGANGSPPPVAYSYLRGKAAQTLGRTRAAVDHFQDAIRAESNFADAHHALGSVWCNQGNYTSGIPALRKATEIDPKNPTYFYALGNALRGDSSRPTRLAEAKEAYEASLELNPAAPWTHYYYGLTLEDMRELEAARREYERTLELHPKFGSAYYRLGGVCQALGRHAEARRYLAVFEQQSQKAIAQVHGERKERAIPDTAEEHYRRGKRLLAAGDRERAAADFRFALQRDPRHGLAQRALREVEGR